jgi:hypothetical protein
VLQRTRSNFVRSTPFLLIPNLMIHSQKPFNGFRIQETNSYQELIDITLCEQDLIWSRMGKDPDVVVCLGTRVPAYEPPIKDHPRWLSDHRLKGASPLKIGRSTEMLLALQFYIELIGPPQLSEVGFICRASIRCRILPSSTAYHTTIEQLRKRRARFHYDY